MHSHNILGWLLLTYARLSHKLKSQGLIRPGIYLDIGYQLQSLWSNCGSSPRAFFILGSRLKQSLHLAYALLVAGESCDVQGKQWLFQRLLRWDMCHICSLSLARAGHVVKLKVLQRCTVSHTGIARGVYYYKRSVYLEAVI